MLGTGIVIYGVERNLDDRVEFTTWLCALWIPLIPLATWSALYLGELPPDGISDERHTFTDIQRTSHDGFRLVTTFARGLLCLVSIVAPIGYMILRTDGRAATKFEFCIIVALCVWPTVLLAIIQKRRKRELNGR